jgi:hypothetical protein
MRTTPSKLQSAYYALDNECNVLNASYPRLSKGSRRLQAQAEMDKLDKLIAAAMQYRKEIERDSTARF